MTLTDYKIKEKSLSYSIEGNGYTIYLEGEKWVSQGDSRNLHPELSCEDACLQHIKSLVRINEGNNSEQEATETGEMTDRDEFIAEMLLSQAELDVKISNIDSVLAEILLNQMEG